MLINELDYLKIADETVHVTGGVYTDTHAYTGAQLGFAISYTGAFALGDTTFTETQAYATVLEEQSNTNYLTTATFISRADAESVAFAESDYQNSLSISRYSSKFSYKSYLVQS